MLLNKKVSICTIAKNCGDTIDMYFRWATANFEEINVVYCPNSEDDTVAKIRKWFEEQKGKPYKIYLMSKEFDNFSAQWERSIAMASKPWIMIVGTDEIIEEVDWDSYVEGIERVSDRFPEKRINALSLLRYNLQRDLDHYKYPGPELIVRLVRRNLARFDGKLVDESLDTKDIGRVINTPFSIIHFGHVRSLEALKLKGKDRAVWKDDDPCDGEGLNRFGEDWFWKRNSAWNEDVEGLSAEYRDLIRKYYLERE
jgi:hypothetical protein